MMNKLKSASEYCDNGYELYLLGKYEEAIVELNKVIALDPKNIEVYILKGITLTNLGKYEEAIVEYNKAIKLDPDNPLPYYSRSIRILARIVLLY
ncbi:MAG: tetratricopeptide repeat protein [Candidatus Rickettsia vulgarisii]